MFDQVAMPSAIVFISQIQNLAYLILNQKTFYQFWLDNINIGLSYQVIKDVLSGQILRGTTILRVISTSLLGNSALQPLKIHHGQSNSYCLYLYGKIQVQDTCLVGMYIQVNVGYSL